jgi:excisionase family DNA binding protein
MTMTLQDAKLQYDLCVAISATLPEIDETALIILRNAYTSLDLARRREAESPDRLPQDVRNVDSPYYTVPDAAAYLRTTPDGVYSLVAKGKLHHVPGRKGRFTKDQLDRAMTTRRKK